MEGEMKSGVQAIEELKKLAVSSEEERVAIEAAIVAISNVSRQGENARKELEPMLEKLPAALKRIGKYRDAKITGKRFHAGATGACIVALDTPSKKTTVILKPGNGEAECFGARLAEAAGLNVAMMHIEDGFVITEDIRDCAGQSMTVRKFGGEQRMNVSEAHLLEDVLAGRAAPGSGAMWRLMGTETGRRKFIGAWLDFLEFSRLALLGDRKYSNAAVAFGDGTAHILSIDMDPVGASIAGNIRDGPDFGGFYGQFAFNNCRLADRVAACSVAAASAGLLQSPIERGRLFDEFIALLEERRKAGPPKDYFDIRDRVISVINDPANSGRQFGMAYDRRVLTPEVLHFLAEAARKTGTKEERDRFMEAQLGFMRQFRDPGGFSLEKPGRR